MIPTAFDEENAVLDAPAGCDPDDVSCLSVFRGADSAGNAVVISAWKPTAEEWDCMRRTGRVWLVVSGETMPPVALSGFNPWGKDAPT